MNAFQKTAMTTVVATLLLIMVGSLVRVSGAGLGCPDWPKCWGCWLPPSSVEEIDRAYISEQGYDLADFNPTKMWIEYINRMIGVAIGFLILATTLRSIPYRKTQPVIFRCSVLSFIIVGFQGWLGGQVVRSGLQPGIITLHMALAITLLSLLLYVTFQAMKQDIAIPLSYPIRRSVMRLAAVLFLLTCIQIVLGTQVREAIDPFIKDTGGLLRSEWLEQVGWIDHIHRASSWLVLIAAVLLYRLLRHHHISGILRIIGLAILISVGIQMTLGVVLAYAGLPSFAQVLHLGVATILVCVEFTAILLVRAAKPV